MPLGSAPLGLFRESSGEPRPETQRTGRPLLRHFLPARGFRREREARKKDHSFPRLGAKLWNVLYH